MQKKIIKEFLFKEGLTFGFMAQLQSDVPGQSLQAALPALKEQFNSMCDEKLSAAKRKKIAKRIGSVALRMLGIVFFLLAIALPILFIVAAVALLASENKAENVLGIFLCCCGNQDAELQSCFLGFIFTLTGTDLWKKADQEYQDNVSRINDIREQLNEWVSSLQQPSAPTWCDSNEFSGDATGFGSASYERNQPPPPYSEVDHRISGSQTRPSNLFNSPKAQAFIYGNWYRSQ